MFTRSNVLARRGFSGATSKAHHLSGHPLYYFWRFIFPHFGNLDATLTLQELNQKLAATSKTTTATSLGASTSSSEPLTATFLQQLINDYAIPIEIVFEQSDASIVILVRRCELRARVRQSNNKSTQQQPVEFSDQYFVNVLEQHVLPHIHSTTTISLQDLNQRCEWSKRIITGKGPLRGMKLQSFLKLHACSRYVVLSDDGMKVRRRPGGNKIISNDD
eukprot:PhM_4_TR14143/c1_g4_i1/m.104348